MSNQRAILLITDDLQASEDLGQILTFATTEPWRPVPPGVNHATYKQERYSREETDRFILELLHRSGGKITLLTTGIVPDPA